MELNKENISGIYESVVKMAKSSFAHKQFDNSLRYIETAANVAYNFNIIYSDLVLENLLVEISKELLGEKKINPAIKGRVVFYDVFGMVNRGLTQQYLRALMKLDLEFMYLLENRNAGVEVILEELRNYNKVKVVIIDQQLSKSDKVNKIFELINEYRPEKALLHLHPGSVEAIAAWNAFKDVSRYQINLTDHAFWLGTGCIDYCLEFRDYGCNVSIDKRGIDSKKLLMQPYYPILDCDDFKGLPSFSDDKVIIFTGGTYYKMYGDQNAFFNILKTLILQNEKAMVVIAGDGDELPLYNFIKRNHFEERIILIGKRTDINHIFEKADIYLSTYPITGGLMAQFAALNRKPILAYSTQDIPCNEVDSLLTFNTELVREKITKHDLDDFFDYAKQLINDKKFRHAEGDSLEGRVIDKDSFASLLFTNLFSPQSTSFKRISIDYERFMNLYIEVANKFVFNFQKSIFKTFKLKVIFLFPSLLFGKWTWSIFSQLIAKKITNK